MTNTTKTATALTESRPATSFDPCTRCGKPLNGKRAVWLELDQRDDTYHNFRDVPADKSQGWFVFGVSCSYAMLHAARNRRLYAAKESA